jgi:hypothetical protein
VNSKEKKTQKDFCPNYVQEFGIWRLSYFLDDLASWQIRAGKREKYTENMKQRAVMKAGT